MSNRVFRSGLPLGVCATALVVILTLLVPLSTSFAAGSRADDVAQGKALFQANCVVCHGANAAGGIKIGTATSADIRSNVMQEMFKGDATLIRRAILQGKDEDGEDLDPVMPRFQGKLSDAQVNAIIAFLMTTGTPAATPASLPKSGDPWSSENLPLLAAAAGLLALGGLGIRQAMRIRQHRV